MKHLVSSESVGRLDTFIRDSLGGSLPFHILYLKLNTSWSSITSIKDFVVVFQYRPLVRYCKNSPHRFTSGFIGCIPIMNNNTN